MKQCKRHSSLDKNSVVQLAPARNSWLKNIILLLSLSLLVFPLPPVRHLPTIFPPSKCMQCCHGGFSRHKLAFIHHEVRPAAWRARLLFDLRRGFFAVEGVEVEGESDVRTCAGILGVEGDGIPGICYLSIYLSIYLSTRYPPARRVGRRRPFFRFFRRSHRRLMCGAGVAARACVRGGIGFRSGAIGVEKLYYRQGWQLLFSCFC